MTFFEELPGKLLDIGVNMVKGLWEGIKSMATWLYDLIKGFATGMVGAMKKALGIASPSKVLAQQIGKWIPEGIAKGILDNIGVVDAAVSKISGNITVTPQSQASQNNTSVVYNFYSPTALDEYTIAQNTLREGQRLGLLLAAM